jgi:hypothetical protein
MHREPGHAPDGETRGVTIGLPCSLDTLNRTTLALMCCGLPLSRAAC